MTVETLMALLDTRGSVQYGEEAVTQKDHALQCAFFAQQQGARTELVVACLLHDVGHLLHDLEAMTARGLDDRHEYRAMPLLTPLFPPAVTEPIRLHVAAKRYLCAVDPNYKDGLSPASQRSLQRQGGVFSAEAAAAFMQQPYAQDAVQLRRWDDRAKVPALATPPLAHFRAFLMLGMN